MGHGLLGPSKGDYHFWKSLEIIWNFNWFKTKQKKNQKTMVVTLGTPFGIQKRGYEKCLKNSFLTWLKRWL